MTEAKHPDSHPDSQSREFDPSRGIFPSNGITSDQLFKMNETIAIPACQFYDELWNSGMSSDIRFQIINAMSSNKMTTLEFDGTTYLIPEIRSGRLLPVKLPFMAASYGEIDLENSMNRSGLTPTFLNSTSNSMTVTWQNRPLISGNEHLGNMMGLCPLWVRTPKGTKNREDIFNKLKMLTYYVFVFVETSFRINEFRWNPIVLNRNPEGFLVFPDQHRSPAQNMTLVPKSSPHATWNSVKQVWILPEPRTQLPGLNPHCVSVMAKSCGLQWFTRSNVRVAYVKYRTRRGIYLGADHSMKCDSWKEYKELHKGKTVQLQIDCSVHKRFSANAFEDGYGWDEDIEMWIKDSSWAYCPEEEEDEEDDCDWSDGYESDGSDGFGCCGRPWCHCNNLRNHLRNM